MVEKLITEGCVDYWAMDIKNSEELYEETSGAKVDLGKIKKSIKLIMNQSKPIGSCETNYEFRTTFVPGLHTIESAGGIGKLVAGAKTFVIQNFQNGKMIDEKCFRETRSFTDKELVEFKGVLEKYVEQVAIRS